MRPSLCCVHDGEYDLDRDGAAEQAETIRRRIEWEQPSDQTPRFESVLLLSRTARSGAMSSIMAPLHQLPPGPRSNVS